MLAERAKVKMMPRRRRYDAFVALTSVSGSVVAAASAAGDVAGRVLGFVAVRRAARRGAAVQSRTGNRKFALRAN